MRNYFVFLKKENMEFFRTKRFLGLGAIFLFFAFTSPILARYVLEFLALFLPAEDGLQLLLPDPVWTDSYAQFYGNIDQIGTIAIILLFMGVISSEKQRNTADLVLTKGLTHTGFVLAKFTVLALALFVITMLSLLIVYAYTAVLFDTAGEIGHVLLGALVYTLFLILILAFILLCGAFARTPVVSALLSFVGFLTIVLLSSLPRIGTFLPGALHAHSRAITAGHIPETLVEPIAITLGLTALFLILAILVLKKQEGE